MQKLLARSPEPEAHDTDDKVLDNSPDRIGIWKCWFLRRGENWSTRRRTSRSKEENQQQTRSTYDAGSGNRTRDTGGRRALSPLRHPCSVESNQAVTLILVFVLLRFRLAEWLVIDLVSVLLWFEID